MDKNTQKENAKGWSSLQQKSDTTGKDLGGFVEPFTDITKSGSSRLYTDDKTMAPPEDLKTPGLEDRLRAFSDAKPPLSADSIKEDIRRAFDSKIEDSKSEGLKL